MSTYPRRDFLFWLVRAAALATGATAGCGGSSSGGGGDHSTSSPSASATPTPSPTPIATPIPNTPPQSGVSVQVTQSEIGGGDLTIPSLYQGQIAVGSGGTAALTQSTIGAQLHLVTDPLGKLRAAAITVPTIFGTTAPGIVFDAHSTALALIFLTPGILTVDPTEAATRLTRIAALSNFTELVTFLGQNLPLSSIEELVAGATLPGLLAACIEPFFPSLSSGTLAETTSRHTTQRGQQTRQTQIASTFFSAQWLTGTATNGEPVFEGLNGAWRWTSVVAQKIGSDGTTQTGNPVPLNFVGNGFGAPEDAALDGPLPAHSWSEFAANVAPASIAGVGDTAPGLANDHSTAILRLWIYGPGGSAGSTSAPAGIDALHAKSAAWGQSILGYIVAPLLDLILGGPVLLPHGAALIDTVWNQIGSSMSLSEFTSGSVTVDSSGTLAAALKAALVPLPNLVVPAIATNTSNVVTSASLSQAEQALALAIATLAPGHFTHFAATWGNVPVSGTFDLTVSSVGIGIQ